MQSVALRLARPDESRRRLARGAVPPVQPASANRTKTGPIARMRADEGQKCEGQGNSRRQKRASNAPISADLAMKLTKIDLYSGFGCVLSIQARRVTRNSCAVGIMLGSARCHN
jgi:hypothetical protein